MSAILWIVDIVISAVITYFVDVALRKPVPQRWRYVTGFVVFLVVFFAIAYIASPYVRDVTKAWLFSNSTDRKCFFDAHLTSPEGAELEIDAKLYDVPLDTPITWEPNSCVMVVQGYQEHDLVKELDSQETGEPTVRQATFSTTGETELKIFREGFETPSNSIWIRVVP